MAKIKKKKSGGSPGISTASLPDIVFMLLFFFMVTTTMRDTTLKLSINTPQATEIEKLEKKSLVNYIYVGEPIEKAKFGSAPRIQLNDAFATVDDIQEYIILERAKVDEKLIPQLTTSIKADKDVKMGIITDIKQELRKIEALKINYSAKPRGTN